MMSELQFTVSEFIVYLNQTLEVAYPYVEIVGEVSNFRVSKGKWVYFDLKDEESILRCFTTVYALPGPLQDGMMVRAAGSPRLHPLYNFTFNVQAVTPVGEGSLRKQADLLRQKLEAEGLFDPARKRSLPSVPRRIALITSIHSAAYADFIKIARARWGGLVVEVYDVQVQGESAVGQIVTAFSRITASVTLPEVVVVVRGGGSSEDLAAFNDERVVRAVATSRVPTLVAIGHEIDISLAEIAADVRASTPSNAAELLLPDKKMERHYLRSVRRELNASLHTFIAQRKHMVQQLLKLLDDSLVQRYHDTHRRLRYLAQLLAAYNPRRPLAQGYALLRAEDGGVLSSVVSISRNEMLQAELMDGRLTVQVKTIERSPTHDKKDRNI